jgi:antirestriction protein ArdC
MATRDLAYQIITDRIIRLLEQGTVPWHRPWNPESGWPRNGATQRPYRGINVFMLGCQGYRSPHWYTRNQINAAGGRIGTNERASYVVFWKILGVERDREDGTTQRETVPLLRYYRVWNVEQTRGLKAPPTEAEPDRQHDPIAACAALVADYPDAPAIAEHPTQAFYRPNEDTVHIPRLGRFETAEDYYATLFHELTHSTGHPARLNRPTLKDALRFGDTNYSKEELVAEMGAAYLCGLAGIDNRTIDQSASYLDHWLSRLRRDHRLLVLAAAQAQKAVDHITGQPAGRVAS